DLFLDRTDLDDHYPSDDHRHHLYPSPGLYLDRTGLHDHYPSYDHRHYLYPSLDLYLDRTGLHDHYPSYDHRHYLYPSLDLYRGAPGLDHHHHPLILTKLDLPCRYWPYPSGYCYTTAQHPMLASLYLARAILPVHRHSRPAVSAIGSRHLVAIARVP